MAREYNLTHERLLDVLDFDPATGVFVWKVARSNRVKVGSRAGVLHQPSGGRYISIDNEKFMAHRLAFFFVNKRWPNTDVRPTDGNYDNCAIENLKEVSRVALAHQRTAPVNNTSGFLGVSRTSKGKWQASITWNYKQLSLGANYESPEAAAEVQQEALRRLSAASSQAECDQVLDELRIWKGQKTAWRFLERSGTAHVWASFETFCADVREIPVMRYSLVPLDATKPIGPDNFRWAYPPDASRAKAPDAHSAARRANRHVERNKELKKLFGIDAARYQEMLLAQNGVCDICEKPETKIESGRIRMLSVDHDHKTGAIRSLLCANCNMALGYFCDDPELLRKAIGYLQKHSGTSNVRPFTPAIVNGELGTGS